MHHSSQPLCQLSMLGSLKPLGLGCEFEVEVIVILNVKRCLRCSRVGVIGGKWVK